MKPKQANNLRRYAYSSFVHFSPFLQGKPEIVCFTSMLSKPAIGRHKSDSRQFKTQNETFLDIKTPSETFADTKRRNEWSQGAGSCDRGMAGLSSAPFGDEPKLFRFVLEC